MPSTRSQPLNPKVAGLPPRMAGVPPALQQPAAAAPSVPPARRPAPASAAVPEVDADDEQAEAARAGGFHESSYELRLGLDVSESEWPDDTTVPGKLGPR